MMNKHCARTAVFTLMMVTTGTALAQEYHVELPVFTWLNDVHLTLFSSLPAKPLRLPRVDTTGARFFTLFYSWKISDEPDIAVMLVPTATGEKLYIDLNNNGSLSDDGPPLFFPAAQNNLTFDLVSPNDSRQRTRLLLQRKPTLADSVTSQYVDSTGNLNPRFATIWGGLTGHIGFDGKKGTFYFDNRVTLKSGTVTVAGATFGIALFDYSNNGLFDDEDDVLLVGHNRDGEFSYPDEATGIKDVFTLNGKNLVLSHVDRYGSSVDLRVTADSPTFSFLETIAEQSSKDVVKGTVSDSLWMLTMASLGGDSVSMNGYRGKYLLLTFWGEWCGPCVAEIPALREARRRHGLDKLQMIGLLSTNNPERAQRIIKEQGVDWPQVVMSDRMQKDFRIRSYPTNVLIFPDGKQYVRAGMITPKFFEAYVH